ncbi:MAG: hypothetical protein H0U10_03495 [Chloroflexia bacterium]|nr:hypothetical protein [Chloroflexia bacterium]
MVTVNRRTRQRPAPVPSPAEEDDGFELPPLLELSEDEGRAFFDREARRQVGLSGEEFLRRYDRGDYAGIEEDEFGRAVVELSFLVSFGR